MKKKSVLITGASSGIGREMAKLFAMDGNRVYAVARSKEKLDQLKNELVQLNKNTELICIVSDIASEIATETIGKALSEESHLDVMINNAGTLINKPFEKMSRDEWQSLFNTNVTSVYFLIQSLLPKLKASENNPSHIVNIGSMGGYQGSAKFSGLSAYSASKAALANVTECLAEELKDYHIKINCLAIGSVMTEMLKSAFPAYNGGADPHEMAHFISNFATNAHFLMNGKVIPVANSTP